MSPIDQKAADEQHPSAPGSIEARKTAEKGPIPDTTTADPHTTDIHPAISVVTEEQEAYRALPPHRKAWMHLGFHRPDQDFERVELKDDKRILAITGSNKQIAALEKEILAAGLALPLDTPVISGPDSSTITKLYLLPAFNNSYEVAKISTTKGLPAAIAVSRDTMAVIRTGDQVVPLDPSLLSHTQLADIDRTYLEIAHWDPAQVERPRKAPEGISPTIFGEPTFKTTKGEDKAKKAASLKLAQKKERTQKSFTEGDTYLIIDTDKLLQKKAETGDAYPEAEKLLAKIASLSVSKDFFTTTDQKGRLLIINRSQRGGSRLGLIATEIEQFAGNKANMFFAKGTFKRTKSRVYGMENYPDSTTLSEAKDLANTNPGTYMTPQTYQALGGRDSTTAGFEVEEVTGSELLRLKKVERKVRLRIGGPDKFIGNEEELTKAKKALSPKSKSRLLILNGGAGSGKSRMADEILKDHPSALIHSVDASGENYPGSALADLVITISNALETRLDADAKTRFSEELFKLKRFAEKPEEERVKESISSPKTIVENCLNGLLILEKCNGSFVFTVDDVHHMDRHSEPLIMDLVEKFLTQSRASKALLMRRPEEHYHSTSQRKLATNIHDKFDKDDEIAAVTRVNLENEKDGKPKLNLQDPAIAHEYVLHSLPENLRAKLKTDASWPMLLASKCRTPFDLTSLINGLLANPEECFIEGSDSLDLKSNIEEEISGIESHEDLISYHQNRMRRLSDDARNILQCVAILGTNVNLATLLLTAQKVAEVQEAEAKTAIDELKKGGYLLVNEEGKHAIQHDNYKDIALAAMEESEKNSLILKLYIQIKDLKDIPNDRKFSLLAQVADKASLSEKNQTFWKYYTGHAEIALKEAEKSKSHSRGYAVAMTILGNLKADNPSTLCRALAALQDPSRLKEALETPTNIRDMLITALSTVISNGVSLGHSKEVTAAITILENLKADDLLTQAYLCGFKAAQIKLDKKAMQAYYNKSKEREDLKPHDRLSMEIRLAFINGNYQGCKQLFQDNRTIIADLRDSGNQAYIELHRFAQRIAFESIRKRLEDDTCVDGDVVLDPGWLSQEETQKFLQIKRQLGKISRERQTNPDKLTPEQELYLMDQQAELAAFLGNYQEASELLSEVWRIAQQMQNPDAAVRAAKSKVDIELMMAIAQIDYPSEGQRGQARAIPNGTIQRKHAIKAIQTCTKNGFPCLSELQAEDNYQLFIRAQRMRATSILVRSYQNEIETAKTKLAKDEIKSDLVDHLRNAIEDFAYLNRTSHWREKFNNPAESGIHCHYSTSSMGHILQCIENLGITEEEIGTAIPDILDWYNYPAFKPQHLDKGLEFNGINQDHVGETVNGKLAGMGKLIHLGIAKATRQSFSQKVTALDPIKERLKATQAAHARKKTA